MRRRFTLNDFEHSLKEHADEFKMMPSKRVWHGIYNDIHPGRRWPSVAVAFLLMFTLVIVGHLNTHNGVDAVTRYSKNVGLRDAGKINSQISTNHSAHQKKKIAPFKVAISAGYFSPINEAVVTISDNSIIGKSDKIVSSGKATTSANNVINKSSNRLNTFSQKNNNEKRNADIDTVKENAYVSSLDNNLDADNNKIYANIGAANQLKGLQSTTNSSVKSLDVNDAKTGVLGNGRSVLGSNTVRSFSHKKTNPNVSWTYFAEPVISNVILKGKSITGNTAASNISPVVGVNVRQNKVLHSPALGLEAGLQLNYKMFGKLKFTGGFEITYSGYRITSNEVHPTFATLTLKDKNTNVDYSKKYVTHYGNGIGEAMVTLRNYSWQASLPLGLQYQIAGNHKIQFNVTANFEPSLILKSNAFLLSTEGANYVNDPALLRKWNASSNAGAFISFSAGKLKWHVGPNVRYQWFSTYKTDYTIREHLIDYGFRISIEK